MERIDVKWLKEGENIVRFTVPAAADHSYRVKNVRIEMDDVASGRELILLPESRLLKEGLYVSGFVTGQGADEASVFVEGIPVDLESGAFEFSNVHLNAKKVHIAVEVIFPDGEQHCEELFLDEGAGTDFFITAEKRGATKEQVFQPGESGMVRFKGAGLSLGENALNEATHLSITTLRDVDMPPLDPGMVNVTKDFSGYRLLPHGTVFNDRVKLNMGFDPCKIPDGYTEKDIRPTFLMKNHITGWPCHWILYWQKIVPYVP